MPAMNFASVRYVPVLAASEVERIAYSNLAPATRDAILPIFELSRHRAGIDFSDSLLMLQQALASPFLLDVDKRVAPPPYQAANPSNPAAEAERVARETAENDAFNSYLNGLLAPADGFSAWRSLVGELENAIPVLQYTNPGSQANAIIRQAALLNQAGNSIAIRILQGQSDLLCNLAAQIFAILPTSNQLLLIFDCGQGRRGMPEKAEWVRNCIQSITANIEVDQIAGISAVCMSNSYPQLQHSGLRIVDSCDREIWAEASEAFPFIFGDYAASHRTSSLSSFLPRSYRATVVHSQDHRWVTHRHENADDPTGWQVGAAAIAGSGAFDPIDSWTDNSIQQAAANTAHGMDTPRPWHAARVAGHIERQANYAVMVDEDG